MYAFAVHFVMKINRILRKKKGASTVKIPGGGTVLYAHITGQSGGHLKSVPLSRAETRMLAHGPVAALRPKIKEVMAGQIMVD